MDLIGSLTQQLGIDSNKATGLAGGLMGLVQSQVKQHLGDDVAKQIAGAIPEAANWQQAAAPAAPSAGGLGDMLGAVAGMAGGNAQSGAGAAMGMLGGLLGGDAGAALKQAGDVAALSGLLGKLNIGSDKAMLVAPMLLNFLKSKLDPGLVSKVLGALPMLAAVTGGGGAAAPQPGQPAQGGGVLGALTGLLK
jgi:hypothetical protein